MPYNKSKHIRWFEETRIGSVLLVGGNNAFPGEIYRALTSKGMRIPDMYSVTDEAYWHILEARGTLEKLKCTMVRLNTQILQPCKKGENFKKPDSWGRNSG